jgi:hypothetical protein
MKDWLRCIQHLFSSPNKNHEELTINNPSLHVLGIKDLSPFGKYMSIDMLLQRHQLENSLPSEAWEQKLRSSL